MMGAVISDVTVVGELLGLEQTTTGVVNILELLQWGLFLSPLHIASRSGARPAQPFILDKKCTGWISRIV